MIYNVGLNVLVLTFNNLKHNFMGITFNDRWSLCEFYWSVNLHVCQSVNRLYTYTYDGATSFSTCLTGFISRNYKPFTISSILIVFY